MEDLMKDRDCLLIKHKTLGKVMAGYYQGKFVSIDTFLKVDSPYDDTDIQKVYLPKGGELKEVSLSDFRKDYKTIKSFV